MNIKSIGAINSLSFKAYDSAKLVDNFSNDYPRSDERVVRSYIRNQWRNTDGNVDTFRDNELFDSSRDSINPEYSQYDDEDVELSSSLTKKKHKISNNYYMERLGIVPSLIGGAVVTGTAKILHDGKLAKLAKK